MTELPITAAGTDWGEDDVSTLTLPSEDGGEAVVELTTSRTEDDDGHEQVRVSIEAKTINVILEEIEEDGPDE